jgi:hypothetical protein
LVGDEMGVNKITFGLEKYRLQSDMENWCNRHFGPGNWISESEVKDWTNMQVNWTIHSMFGNTTFCFRNPQDYTWFAMQWA